MTHIVFFNELANIYKNARSTTWPSITRCANRVVYGLAEDLFGEYCYELLNNPKPEVFICPKLSLAKKSSPKSTVPDVVICKGSELCEMWDLKMDIGWHRKDLPTILNDHDAIAKAVIGTGTVQINGKQYTISPDLRYNVLVITLKNGGFNSFKVAKGLSLSNSEVFNIFDNTYHPNGGPITPTASSIGQTNMNFIDKELQKLY